MQPVKKLSISLTVASFVVIVLAYPFLKLGDTARIAVSILLQGGLTALIYRVAR